MIIDMFTLLFGAWAAVCIVIILIIITTGDKNGKP
jgi:hypothetical protein